MSDKPIPFDGFFPLPFRVFFLVGLGILLWATNLHGLGLGGIDVATALDLRTSDSGISSTSPLSLRHTGTGLKASALYFPLYRVFVTYSACCFGAWLLFIYMVHGDPLSVDAFRHIPAICGLIIIIGLITTLDVFQKRERDIFLFSLWRCLFSPIDEPIFFSDVVFADVLTSFAKVLGDVWLSLCMLLPGGSFLSLPVLNGWSRWILPTVMSLPYLVRFRQCLIEYMVSTDRSRRPLYNAIKYASSFPVIYLSAAQRGLPPDFVGTNSEKASNVSWQFEQLLFQSWLLAAAVNSIYSFWWDVTNDWGFDLLLLPSPQQKKGKATSLRRLVLPSRHSESTLASGSPSRSSFTPRTSFEGMDHLSSGSSIPQRSYPYGLRPILLFPLPVYPLLIFLDLILRMTWSIKLSSHLHSDSYRSVSIFWLEMAELIRRWMWVFIRVEWEVVRKYMAGELKSGKIKDDDESFEILGFDDGDVQDAGEMDMIDKAQPIS